MENEKFSDKFNIDIQLTEETANEIKRQIKEAFELDVFHHKILEEYLPQYSVGYFSGYRDALIGLMYEKIEEI